MKVLTFVGIAAIASAVVLACSSDKTSEQPKLTREALMDPSTCQTCHTDHYREWSGSMHAYASDDPVFVAMNKRGQRETGGQLGDFCVKCHAPVAFREGLTKDGLNLDSVPAKMKGVTCFFCHQVSAVEGTHDAALKLADPTDTAMRGPFADPVANTAHNSVYSSLHDRDKLDSAGACGACHDIQTGHGAALERTFVEWQASVFAKAPGGATCGQCHMAQSANLQPIAQAPGVFARRRHAHTFAGIDTAMTPFPEMDAQKSEVKSFLDSTLQSALCVGAGSQVRVLLDNVAGGHGFPSGATSDRRVWTEIVGYAGAEKVYESGVVPEGTAVTANPDPDRWLMRDCIFDESGAEVHMFWQAASTEGNALPAQATFDTLDPRFYQTHVAQRFPREGSLPKPVDRVTMKVFVRAMDREVLDDLIATGDLAPRRPGEDPDDAGRRDPRMDGGDGERAVRGERNPVRVRFEDEFRGAGRPRAGREPPALQALGHSGLVGVAGRSGEPQSDQASPSSLHCCALIGHCSCPRSST